MRGVSWDLTLTNLFLVIVRFAIKIQILTKDKSYYQSHVTAGTCVFEISQPKQTDIINLAHFCVNKITLKIIQNKGYFAYFNNIEFPDRSALTSWQVTLVGIVPCFHICISLNVTVFVVSCLMIASREA